MMLFTFMDGLLFSLLSIFLVILLIAIIIIAISPLKNLSKTKEYPKDTLNNPSSKEIKDDDMMVALLVASIDYLETTNKEPYVKSIREIHNENL